MKGIELPINILVIVAIAVIVLLGMVAMFLGGFGPFSAAAGLESVKNTACATLQRGGCSADTSTVKVNFDADQSGTVGDAGDTLENLCTKFYGCPAKSGTGVDQENCCKRVCACPGY